jgi:hypothetical protein
VVRAVLRPQQMAAVAAVQGVGLAPSYSPNLMGGLSARVVPGEQQELLLQAMDMAAVEPVRAVLLAVMVVLAFYI